MKVFHSRRILNKATLFFMFAKLNRVFDKLKRVLVCPGIYVRKTLFIYFVLK